MLFAHVNDIFIYFEHVLTYPATTPLMLLHLASGNLRMCYQSDNLHVYDGKGDAKAIPILPAVTKILPKFYNIPKPRSRRASIAWRGDCVAIMAD